MFILCHFPPLLTPFPLLLPLPCRLFPLIIHVRTMFCVLSCHPVYVWKFVKEKCSELMMVIMMIACGFTPLYSSDGPLKLKMRNN